MNRLTPANPSALPWQASVPVRTGSIVVQDAASCFRVLDALDANVAVIAKSGAIVFVNRGWQSFARANRARSGQIPVGTHTGDNYFDACEVAVNAKLEGVGEALKAIRAVFRGTRSDYSAEYSCDSPRKKRWFVMHVRPLETDGERMVVISHFDITARKLAQLDAQIREQELSEALRQLQDMSEHVQDSIERERQAIATEIHDQIGAALTAAGLLLNRLAASLGTLSGPAQTIFNQIRDQITQTLQTSRRVYVQLRPPMLDDLGLIHTCQWYVSDWGKKTDIDVIGKFCTLPAEPPESLRQDIFRALQELLTNVVRHAKATRVRVTLSVRNNYLSVRVTDNGQGFDPQQIPRGRFGIQGIRSRVERHQGAIHIKRRVTGTTMVATFALMQ